MLKNKPEIADAHIHTRFADYPRTVKMLDDIRSAGVREACILSLPYRGAAENLYALYVKHKYKKINVRAFGGLHVTDRYSLIDPKVQVQSVLELGCDGIKLMFSPDLQKYYGKGIDHPYYDEMFSFLEENNVPVNVHLADPEEFWQEGKQYADGSFSQKEEMYAQSFRMLDKHPKLRVCFAHFMFLSDFPDEAVRVMEKYENVMFDLTPGVEMYFNFDKCLEFWNEFFEKYNSRLLFGTDSNSIKSVNIDLENLVYRKLTKKGEFKEKVYGKEYTFKGLGLSEKTVSQICYGNYFEFLGKEPKELNVEKFRLCCKKIIDDLDKETCDDCYIKGCSLISHLGEDPEQRIAYNFCKKALAEI